MVSPGHMPTAGRGIYSIPGITGHLLVSEDLLASADRLASADLLASEDLLVSADLLINECIHTIPFLCVNRTTDIYLSTI